MKENTKKLSVSEEDYLEAALRLTLKGERIKVTSVAALLGVSKPAATNALTYLASKGLLTKEPYGDILFTDEGKSAAEKVYGKHKLLKEFLLRIGASEQTAEIDCCKMEHVLSEETLQCLCRFMSEHK